MAWYSPRMSTTSPPPAASPTDLSSTNSASIASAPPPETPDSVRDLGPSVCFDVGLFRDLMRQYRGLDDGVTTRLNRTLAQSRSSGQSQSPSLLSESSSSPTYYRDLGKSTYSTLNQSACESFFKELVSNWSGRESVIRYCLAIVDVQGKAADPIKTVKPDASAEDMKLLDADKAAALQGQTATAGVDSRPIFTEWDSRGSRAEKADEALRRQIHNEASVDQIVRTRSLQAFKSRCTLFRLPADASEQERRFWEGR